MLDRHIITIAERIKAKIICERDYGLSYGTANTSPSKKKSVTTYKKGDGFSKGETHLYEDYRTIQ